MSHYICIAIPGRVGSLESLMERYDENREVDPHMEPCYCRRARHRELIKAQLDSKFGEGYIDKLQREFPRDGTQEEWKQVSGEYFRESDQLESAVQLPEANPECEDCNGSGECETTANPDAKWDWFQIGGRWSGEFGGKNITTVREIVACGKIPFAIVTPNGWFERGSMGWFGCVLEEKPQSEWESEARRILESLDPDATAIVLDCHI